MIIYLFFFFCDLAHPDLHSFPTRRSSDLNASGSGGVFALSDAGGALQCHGATCAEDPAVIDLVGWGDRKSTRLNSSHVAISYAVFCLKKKSEQSNRITT